MDVAHDMRAGLVVVLVLTVSLGGLPVRADDPVAQRVQESGCAQSIGFFLLPLAGLQARLPPGFAAWAAEPTGSFGAVFVADLDCADVAVDGRSWGPAREVGTGVLVIPPAAWMSPAVDTYVVATFANTAPGVAMAFRQWSIGSGGDVDVRNFEAPAASLNVATGDYGGMVMTMLAATEGPRLAFPAAHIRAFGVESGHVVGAVDLLNTPAMGRGGPPGGAGAPGQAEVVFEGGPYEVPLLQGFAQHATWTGLALQWDLVA